MKNLYTSEDLEGNTLSWPNVSYVTLFGSSRRTYSSSQSTKWCLWCGAQLLQTRDASLATLRLLFFLFL